MWAFYNAQLLSETELFCDLKLARMSKQLDTFVDYHTKAMNDSLSNFIQLKTTLMMM